MSVHELRPPQDPLFAFQVWDGERYRTSEKYDAYEKADREMERHKRVMPNCPARIVRLQIVAGYLTGQEEGKED